MGGVYLGFKARAVMLKRQQRGPREGNYGVEINRSGMVVLSSSEDVELGGYIADDLRAGGGV